MNGNDAWVKRWNLLILSSSSLPVAHPHLGRWWSTRKKDRRISRILIKTTGDYGEEGDGAGQNELIKRVIVIHNHNNSNYRMDALWSVNSAQGSINNWLYGRQLSLLILTYSTIQSDHGNRCQPSACSPTGRRLPSFRLFFLLLCEWKRYCKFLYLLACRLLCLYYCCLLIIIMHKSLWLINSLKSVTYLLGITAPPAHPLATRWSIINFPGLQSNNPADKDGTAARFSGWLL